MHIRVTEGVGTGPTELSAFDQALVRAGIANYNIIYLSSVLPPDSEVEFSTKAKEPEGEWGDRLYVVMAQKRTSQRNQEAWAGIGWMQEEDSGRGLLVEHEGHSETEVRADIEHSLNALAKNRRMAFGPIQMHIVGAKCETTPVCALVAAVYETTTWRAMRNNRKISGLKLSPLRRR
jgi:arginine decarboxylase